MNDLLATIFTGIIIDENENYFVQKRTNLWLKQIRR